VLRYNKCSDHACDYPSGTLRFVDTSGANFTAPSTDLLTGHLHTLCDCKTCECDYCKVCDDCDDCGSCDERELYCDCEGKLAVVTFTLNYRCFYVNSVTVCVVVPTFLKNEIYYLNEKY